MKNGMNLQELLTEVVRQNESKRDFIADTKESIQMVQQPEGIRIVLLKEGADQLESFEITENCYRQVAGRLNIPWKYFQRLLSDHPDLVIHQVNELFRREPETRLLRTLDGKARAFLSDRYRRLDNAEVLEQVLPPLVQGEIESTMLSSHVNDDNMYLKVLFTDERLAVDLGQVARPGNDGWGGNVDLSADHEVIARRDAGRDIVRPGAIIGNSETGKGSLFIKGFLFRSYCLNGCVWGAEDAFTVRRTHVGGKLIEGQNFEVLSDDTKRKEDELVIAQISDGLSAMTDPAKVQAMGQRLREIKAGEQAQDRAAAVQVVAKELDLSETEQASALENFIADGDFSQWGMANAVTKIANSDETSYERACELEEIGGKLLSMAANQWGRVAQAVAA